MVVVVDVTSCGGTYGVCNVGLKIVDDSLEGVGGKAETKVASGRMVLCLVDSLVE